MHNIPRMKFFSITLSLGEKTILQKAQKTMALYSEQMLGVTGTAIGASLMKLMWSLENSQAKDPAFIR